MRITCYTKMPLLYELYGESLFSLFTSILPQREKEVFRNYEIFVINFKGMDPKMEIDYTRYGKGTIAFPFTEAIITFR